MTTKFVYLRDNVGRPIGCLVIRRTTSDATDGFMLHYDTVDIGYSFCSPLDNFRKDRARQIAQGRLDKCPISVVVARKAQASATAALITRAVEGTGKVPGRVLAALSRLRHGARAAQTGNTSVLA